MLPGVLWWEIGYKWKWQYLWSLCLTHTNSPLYSCLQTIFICLVSSSTPEQNSTSFLAWVHVEVSKKNKSIPLNMSRVHFPQQGIITGCHLWAYCLSSSSSSLYMLFSGPCWHLGNQDGGKLATLMLGHVDLQQIDCNENCVCCFSKASVWRR